METTTRLAPTGERGALGRQGLGMMRLRERAAADADRDPVALIETALDIGVWMVDTADAYRNEELVGRAIRRRRDEVLLASKFGLVWSGEVAADFCVRADPSYVRSACEASLRRLGVERIDLYYLHHRSDEVPVEETVGAMAGLVEAGKIGAVGLSNVTAEDLRRGHATHPVAALQEAWSLVQRGIESELLGTAAALGITVVAHSPTGHGLLHPGGAEVDEPERLGGLRTALHDAASVHGVTTGQVALAWVHHRQVVHGTPVVPLPGTTSIAHLRQALAAADLPLSDDELRRLEAASATPRAGTAS